MIKTTGMVSIILIASTTLILAQNNRTPSVPQGADSQQIVGPTGTMYDGNNADLKLPPEPNKYWANLWAVPAGAGNIGPAGAAAASAAASAAGGPSGAGVQ